MLKTILILILAAGMVLAQWSSDPGENLAVSDGTEEAIASEITTGSYGDTYVAWSDNLDMRLQRFDLLGNPQWGTNGILISSSISTGEVCLYDLISDVSGAAVLTFCREDTGGFWHTYAFRISRNGDMLWGADGILLSDTTVTDGTSGFPMAAACSSGDVVISWSTAIEPDTSWSVLQRIAPDGSLLWGDGIKIGADSTGLYNTEPVICPAGTDDVIICWMISNSEGWFKRLYAQKYNSEGNTVWSSNVTLSDSRTILQQCIQPPAYPDGSGGFYMVWQETDSGSGNITSLAQHVNSGGDITMQAGGSPVSTNTTRNHAEPFMGVADNGVDIFVFWREMNHLQTLNGLYGQRMDMNGSRYWSNSGHSFIGLQEEGLGFIQVQTAGDSALVFYLEDVDLAQNDVACAMLMDSAGGYLWSSERILVASDTVRHYSFRSTPLCMGRQWITAWDDNRNPTETVFAQNVKLDGTLGTSGLGMEGSTMHDPGVYLGVVSPNPLGSVATVPFSITEGGFVNMRLYDLTGRVVGPVKNGFYPAGNHTVALETGDLEAGVYILRLDAMGETVSQKCALLR